MPIRLGNRLVHWATLGGNRPIHTVRRGAQHVNVIDRPKGISATGGGTRSRNIEVSWTAPNNWTEMYPTGWEIRRNGNVVEFSNHPTVSSYTAQGLSNGSYSFEVRGLTRNGATRWSDVSNTVSISIVEIRPPTVNLHATTIRRLRTITNRVVGRYTAPEGFPTIERSTVPAGMSLRLSNGNILLSGRTEQAAGTFSASVTISDVNGTERTGNATWTITEAVAPTISCISNIILERGIPLTNFRLANIAGVSPPFRLISATNVPRGLTASALRLGTGEWIIALNGTPTNIVVSDISLTIRDNDDVERVSTCRVEVQGRAAPCPPGVVLAPSWNSITVSLTPSTASGCGVPTSYEYQVAGHDDQGTRGAWDEIVTGITQTIFTLTDGIAQETQYSVRVRARNLAGVSGWAIQTTTTARRPQAPGIPQPGTCSIGTNRNVTVMFGAPTEKGVPAYHQWRVRWREVFGGDNWINPAGAAGEIVTGTGDLSYTAQLPSEETYEFIVWCENTVGAGPVRHLECSPGDLIDLPRLIGPYSWRVGSAVNQLLPAATITADGVAAGLTQSGISYTLTGLDGENLLGIYGLTFSPSTRRITGTPTTDTAQRGSRYRASYSVGQRRGFDEAIMRFEILPALEIPKPASALSDATKTSMLASYSPGPTGGGFLATQSIRAFFGPLGNPVVIRNDVTGNTFQLTRTGLEKGTIYEAFAIAFDKVITANTPDSDGVQGDAVTLSTFDDTLPGPVRNLLCESESTSGFTVTWDAPFSQVGVNDPATGYEYRISGGDWTSTTSLQAVFTGLDSGTAYNVDVRATNETGNGPHQTISCRTESVVLTLTPQAKYTFTVNVEQYYTLPEAEGGANPYTYTVLGSLPSGISFVASNRRLGGTATAVRAETPFTYRAVDANNETIDAESATEVVNSVPNRPENLRLQEATHNSLTVEWDAPSEMRGTAITGYRWRFKKTSETAWSDWAVTAEDVLTATASTLDEETSYDFEVQATNSEGNSETTAGSFSTIAEVIVDPLALPMEPETLGPFNVGELYVINMPNAMGGVPDYTYSASGTLLTESGFSYNETNHTLTGTARVAGTRDFTLTVTDSAGDDVSVTWENIQVVEVEYPPLELPFIPDKRGEIGVELHESLALWQLPEAQGGLGPYTYTCVEEDGTDLGTTAKFGVSFNATTLRLTGTPQRAPGLQGSRLDLTYTVTDSQNPSHEVSREFACIFSPQSNLRFEPIQWFIPNLPVGTPVRVPFPRVRGGTPPYTWDQNSTITAPGLAFNFVDEVVDGTPTTIGSYSARLGVSDDTGASISAFTNFQVVGRDEGPLDLPPFTIPDLKHLEFYSIPLTRATGGTPDYTYEGSTTAPGMRVDLEQHVFTGTPTELGTFSITLGVTDSAENPASVSRTVRFEVKEEVDELLIWHVSGTYHGIVNRSFNAVLPYPIGGNPPYNFSYVGLEGTGGIFAVENVLSGIPTNEGTFIVNCEVSDSRTIPARARGVITIIIESDGGTGDPLRFIGTVPTLRWEVGRYNSEVLPTAVGGTPGYFYSVEGGVPSGVYLSGTTLAGTPQGPGTFNFTYRVRDSANPSDTATLNITMIVTGGGRDDPLRWYVGGVFNGKVGERFSRTLQEASGGRRGYTYTFTGLPPGLFSSRTTISGTPSVAGSYTTIARVQDSSIPTRQQVTRTLTFIIAERDTDTDDDDPNDPLRFLGRASDVRGVVGTFLSHSLPRATGGSGGYQYTLTGANSFGCYQAGQAMIGIPNRAGRFTCGWTVVDSSGTAVGPQIFTADIRDKGRDRALTIVSANLNVDGVNIIFIPSAPTSVHVVTSGFFSANKPCDWEIRSEAHGHVRTVASAIGLFDDIELLDDVSIRSGSNTDSLSTLQNFLLITPAALGTQVLAVGAYGNIFTDVTASVGYETVSRSVTNSWSR